MSIIVAKPVTRSKGGWRRKPRRVTQFVIDNYWPDGQRIAALRRHWPSYKPWWEVVDRINRFPAPKPVTLWQCRMMASYVGVRRPADIGTFTRHAVAISPGTIALRVRNRGAQPMQQFIYEPVKPESTNKLRKVGRKPKPKKARRRKTPRPTATEGLTLVGPRSWRQKAAQNRQRGKPRRGKGRKARRKAGRKS